MDGIARKLHNLIADNFKSSSFDINNFNIYGDLIIINKDYINILIRFNKYL